MKATLRTLVVLVILTLPVSAMASDLVVEIGHDDGPVITSMSGNPEENILVEMVGDYLWVNFGPQPESGSEDVGTSSIQIGPDVVSATITETGHVTLAFAPVPEPDPISALVVIDVEPEEPATFELPYFFRPLAMR